MKAADRKPLTIRSIEAMKVGDTLWDGLVPGLVVRYRTANGRKHFGLQVRVANRQRFMTIGPLGSPWSVDTARSEAKRMLGRIEAGENLASVRDAEKAVPTVEQAWSRFMAEHVCSKLKSRSADQYEFMGRLYILPAFGKDRIDAIEPANVAHLHHKMRDHKVTANRTTAALSKFMAWCEQRGLRKRNSNPCVDLERFREQKRDTFLTDAELERLGDALVEFEADPDESPYFVAFVRLLILTGARHNEIKTLTWNMVDTQRGLLVLPDSKTGRKVIVLSAPATAVLAGIERKDGNPFVIAGQLDGAHAVNVLKAWNRLCAKARLEGVRLHDLRHSFASVAAARGASLPMIGKLLGHSQPQTTARYAHLSSDPLRDVADQAGSAIEAAMNRKRLPSAEIVPLNSRKAG